MNRRNFLRSLSIATAAIYLQISPAIAKTVPMEWTINHCFAASAQQFHDALVRYITESDPFMALLRCAPR